MIYSSYVFGEPEKFVVGNIQVWSVYFVMTQNPKMTQNDRFKKKSFKFKKSTPGVLLVLFTSIKSF